MVEDEAVDEIVIIKVRACIACFYFWNDSCHKRAYPGRTTPNGMDEPRQENCKANDILTCRLIELHFDALLGKYLMPGELSRRYFVYQ